jgi:Fe(3+) dicitrate transport protein
MYYSPPIDRMIGVEVLKGSGSIVYGPQTIGGVLNFITPEPPLQQQTTVDLTGGQYGFFSGQASHGGTKGRTGWYVNLLRKQGDGWRDLFFGLNDVIAKLNVTLNERHRLAWKFGGYDERSNSTYLGLTESQFRRDPGFNAVPDDFLRVRRYSGSLAHTFTLSPSAVLTTTGFGYSTTRNWRRQDFDRAPKAGVEYLRIVGDRAIPGDAIYLRNSTGNNNREFDVIGAESRLGVELSRQRIEAGIRYLFEEHRDRRVDGSSYIASTGMTREYEVRHGHATSAFVQDRVFLTPRLTLTPGLRLERYRYSRDIRRQPVAGVPTDVDIQRADTVMKPIPGLGIAYQTAGPLTLFAGVHRGFAPPRVKDAITRSGVSLELDAELSWNYEAGARLALARGLRAEATVFETDFSNQIIPAAVSGGATTSLVNAGRTLHRGAEFSLAADWTRLARTGLFTEVRYTWLPLARFESGESFGKRLPYAPEATVSLEAGWRHRSGFQIGIDGTRVSGQFADNRETWQRSADGTIGRIPAHWVWNASAGKEFAREHYSVRPYVMVKNMADSLYVSSRAPLGIHPGMARQVNGGIRLRF